jgi:hypothetical protein
MVMVETTVVAGTAGGIHVERVEEEAAEVR